MRNVLLVSLLAVPAFAFAVPQAGGGRAQTAAQQLEQRFKQADSNGDGKLTKEEAAAGMPRLAGNFSRIDSGGNGYVTLDQVRAFAQQAAAAGGR